jgi:hypothetical protein
MDDELWSYVAERASRRGISPNAWIVRMVRLVRDGKLTEPPAKGSA